MKKVLKKIFNIIIDILVVVVLAMSVLIVTLSLTTKSSGVPTILGYAPLSVQSGSMEHTFDPGDLIIGKVTNDPSATYKKGDIVTFPVKIEGVETYNTHRIVDVAKDKDITYYQTQGDNRKTNPKPDSDLQTSATIVAKYTGTRIAGLGNVLTFLRTQLGFFLCVLLPMIIFFMYEAIRVVMNIIAYNKEKAIAAAEAAVNNSELSEEQKKKAINEYLASIGTKQNQKNNDKQTAQTPAESDNVIDDSDNSGGK